MAERKRLPHEWPNWLNDLDGPVFFITVCQERKRKQSPLTEAPFAEPLMASIHYSHDQQHWYCHLAVLMPDHVHALISPGTKPLNKAVQDWKHYSACKIGIQWQPDFFEHRLRHEESVRDKAEYILQNPVRTGLVATPQQWPHLWIAK